MQILLLSRLAFAGGSDVVLAHLQSSADVLSEVQLDATCNLILVAGLLSQGEAADPSKFAMVTAVESLADQQLMPPAGRNCSAGLGAGCHRGCGVAEQQGFAGHGVSEF